MGNVFLTETEMISELHGGVPVILLAGHGWVKMFPFALVVGCLVVQVDLGIGDKV